LENIGIASPSERICPSKFTAAISPDDHCRLMGALKPNRLLQKACKNSSKITIPGVRIDRTLAPAAANGRLGHNNFISLAQI